MGKHRGELGDGIKDGKEKGRQTIELGSKIVDDSGEVKKLIKDVKRELQDDEDIRNIEQAEGDYQNDFDKAFDEQVEKPGEEIRERSEKIQESASDGLEKARHGIGNLERAAQVSDIGRRNAESAREKLEGGAREYEDIISQARETAEQTAQEIQKMKQITSRRFR